MDPTRPAMTEEEEIRGSGQTVRKKTFRSPTEQAEEVTLQQSTPTGQTLRTTKRIGASSEYAHDYERKKIIFHTYRVIWYILGFLEILLVSRFTLKALGANPDSGFADLVYNMSYPFAKPFINLFSPTTGAGAETVSFVEWSTLVAMLVYVFVAWAIEELLRLIKPIRPEEVERTVESQ